MRKSLIFLGMAAAAACFASPAGAIDVMEQNPDGFGHILLIPYFSTQAGNVTAINIVNTDLLNGKVLKIRFRGASNGDNVYNFQIFLSPGDVWTAGIAQDSDGRARLDTVDRSCTLPANVSGGFLTTHISPAGGASETREGYVEILTMADIVNDEGGYASLFQATRHVGGVPPCNWDVLSALTHENADQYMAPPTTGLMANWTIVNVAKVFAYSGAAVAFEARDILGGNPVDGELVYWDQRATPLSQEEAAANTADPQLRGTAPAEQGTRNDLPDLSTPYTDAAADPFDQSLALSNAMASVWTVGEFFNLDSVVASTDWVFSFPTRRYMVAVNYGATANSILWTAASDGNIYFTAANASFGDSINGGKPYQLCQRFPYFALNFQDREERLWVHDVIVISGPPDIFSLCGAVSVIGINRKSPAESATFAEVADATEGARGLFSNGFVEGWGGFQFQNGGYGLPLVALQFTRVSNTFTNHHYGLSYPMRVRRGNTFER